jgi:signal transduction histidine kinase
MDLRSISSSKEVVYFDRLITEVIEYLQPQKRFRDVEIVTSGQFDAIPFDADATQIQQLLYNLFHNAADALVSRDIRQIKVSVELLREQDSFKVGIEDTGVGFDPELLSKAFHEKFTTKDSGHGFGLVVCKRIIDNHGGELSVESSPGEGTCISITFPLATQAVEMAELA